MTLWQLINKLFFIKIFLNFKRLECLRKINPKQAGGSESMYSLGGSVWRPPPLEKALENRFRVEMHVHSPIFQGQLKEKKLDR